MPTRREFNIGLYREHLAEASFLYEQRLAHLHDPEVLWPDIRYLEERFEAHIDALVLGGELALEVCRQPDDAGEMHAALCVFCRRDLKDDGFAILNALDPEDDQAVGAASRALRSEAPAAWRDDLLRRLQRNEPDLTHVLAHVAGFRRYPGEELLARRLAAKPSVGSADLAWALGRVGSARSVSLLSTLLDSDDERVCEAAAIALLRIGDDRVLQRAMRDAPARTWARRVLGIGGSSRSVGVLLDVLTGPAADEDTVLALGLLGDLAAVAPLLELLEDEKLGAPAGVALNTVTGAGLYTTIFVPDTFDPDELFGEEREAYDKDGALPTRLGEPYGNWERGALRDRTAWQTWLAENRHRFSREHRWRMGQPYGPAALFECLRSATSPYAVRRATYEELVVRYGFDVPFEVELRVSQQAHCLRRAEEWVAGQSGTLPDGQYVLGRSVSGLVSPKSRLLERECGEDIFPRWRRLPSETPRWTE